MSMEFLFKIIWPKNCILTKENLGMMSRMLKNLTLNWISHACLHHYPLLLGEGTEPESDRRLHLMTLTSDTDKTMDNKFSKLFRSNN